MKHLRKFNESISYDDVFDFIQRYFPYIRNDIRQTPHARTVYREYIIIEDDGSITLKHQLGRFNSILIDGYKSKELPFKFNVKDVVKLHDCDITNLKNLPSVCRTLILTDCPNLTSLEGSPTKFEDGGQQTYGTGKVRINSTALLARPKFPTKLYNPNWYPVGINSLGIDSGYEECTNSIRYRMGKWREEMTVFTNSPTDPKYLQGTIFPVPFFNIVKLFVVQENGLINFFESVKDYDYIRDNQIVKPLFDQACREYGLKMPEKIDSYTWLE